MKEVFYRQCHLKKRNKDGTHTEQISYIPEPFCVKGKVVKLRDESDEWSDGWVIEWAAEKKVSDKLLPDYHKEIKGHRQNTGDVSR